MEYFVYFIFQLLSYFLLETFWSKWYIGLIIFCVHLAILLGLIISLRVKSLKTIYILKPFEFLASFFLYGWAAGYFGIDGYSLTAIMIINYCIVLVYIQCMKEISIMVLIIMLILLMIDAVVDFALSSNWWEPTILLIYLTIQVLVFNYESKQLWDVSKMENPDQYINISLSTSIKFYYMRLYHKQQKQELKAGDILPTQD